MFATIIRQQYMKLTNFQVLTKVPNYSNTMSIASHSATSKFATKIINSDFSFSRQYCQHRCFRGNYV